MIQRIKNVMAAIFKVDVSKIDDNASPDTLENWDSLGHMNLIVALEEEFNISFKEDEIVEMLNYKLVYETIKNRIS
jgi:acyl carrier protein